MSGQCSCCRVRAVQVKKHGWCRACRDRWKRAGCPVEGPPEPSKGGRPRVPAIDERASETRRLLSDGDATVKELADRYGVCPQTVLYYRERR